MKKIILASAISMSLISGAVNAAGGEVQFIGAVTDVTCDITPEIDGSLTKNVIQLGTVAPTETSKVAATFSLKPADPAAPGCAGLTPASIAQISWMGPFNTEGLAAQSGTADDAIVLLSTANASGTAKVSMTKSNVSADFAGNLAITDGFQYTAELKGGAKKGDFATSAAFVVAYK